MVTPQSRRPALPGAARELNKRIFAYTGTLRDPDRQISGSAPSTQQAEGADGYVSTVRRLHSPPRPTLRRG